MHRFTHLFTFLFVCALLVSGAASLEAREEIDRDAIWNDLREELYEGRTLHDGSELLTLDTPYRAMDAAIVPISVTVKKDQIKGDYIKSLMIVIDENPAPVAAIFNMSPHNGNASLDTRIRIDRYTHVRAIAEDNNGELYAVSNFVKAAGGCSAPALADMGVAEQRRGQMKFKFKEVNDNGVRRAQLLISHPNYSGLQFNQLTRREIPSHFVDSVEVRSGERILFKVESGISISENPAFTFNYYDLSGNDPITVHVTDSEGHSYEKSWSPQNDNMSQRQSESAPKS